MYFYPPGGNISKIAQKCNNAALQFTVRLSLLAF